MMIEEHIIKKKIYFKSSRKFLEDRKVEIKNKTYAREDFEKFIYCKLCFNKITLNSEKIAVDGKFSHEVTNPADIKFVLGCFANVFGCISQGIPTLEATWFPAYEWTFVICKKCSEHLGWYFQRGDDSFFGLIIPKLEGDL